MDRSAWAEGVPVGISGSITKDLPYKCGRSIDVS